MIIKIWPIKADYGGKRGKKGGAQGLKNSIDYITDPEKTGNSEAVTVRVSDTGKNSFINRERDMQRVIRYMANEDKIDQKYISGYLCNPLLAAEEFERAMTHYGKKVKGNIAYHMVQSFPEELDISDEEVHQCGIELCERLGLYQAVICSHVHPVLDEDGVLHGNSKHNHILFNAYPFPSKYDPKTNGPLKYHDCKASYRQLQIWNDEIAIEHGLPIIRTPDMERTYSWSEVDAAQKGVSWKEKIRTDIDEAKKEASNWDEFVSLMKEKHYQIRDGKQTSYLAPDGKHRARGSRLGKHYTRENLEKYWKLREEMLENVERGVQDNVSPSLAEFIQQGAKTVGVPLGFRGKENQSVHQMSLGQENVTEDALYSYFEHNKLYEIYNAQGEAIAALSGKEIIAYYLDKDTDAERNARAAKETEEYEDAMARRREQNENAFYSNLQFQNSRTKKPYRVRFYDKSGRRISNIEAMFYLAMVVLKHEDGLWLPTTIPPDKMNEACYATTNWKLQNMVDSLRIAQEEGIEKPADLDLRLQNTGAAYSRARASLKRNQHVKEKMEDLKNAIVTYEKTRQIAEMLSAMPDGPEKNEKLRENNDTLVLYKEARAVMYAHGLKTETLDEQIVDFKRRWRHMEDNIREATRQYDETRESYRKLKKLQYNMALAESTKYCYGPEYQTDDRTRKETTRQRSE